MRTGTAVCPAVCVHAACCLTYPDERHSTRVPGFGGSEAFPARYCSVSLYSFRIQPQPPLQVQLSKRSKCVDPANRQANIMTYFRDHSIALCRSSSASAVSALTLQQGRRQASASQIQCIRSTYDSTKFGLWRSTASGFSARCHCRSGSAPQKRQTLHRQTAARDQGQHVIQKPDAKLCVTAGPGKMYYKRSMQNVLQKTTHFSRLATISCQCSTSCSSVIRHAAFTSSSL
jgi:hypothetical protein